MPEGLAQGCDNKRRKGGLEHLVFMKCNKTFADITDLAEWTQKIQDGDLVASGKLLGQKPKGSFTKAKFSSSTPEEVTGKTDTYQFKDYNSELSENKDIVFWSAIQKNYQKYLLGVVDTEDRFRGFFDNYSPEIDDVIEEDINGNTYIDGSIAINTDGIVVPVTVPGLGAVIKSTSQTP